MSHEFTNAGLNIGVRPESYDEELAVKARGVKGFADDPVASEESARFLSSGQILFLLLVLPPPCSARPGVKSPRSQSRVPTLSCCARASCFQVAKVRETMAAAKLSIPDEVCVGVCHGLHQRTMFPTGRACPSCP